MNRHLWRPIFLAVLRSRGRVRLACDLSGIRRGTAYEQRHRDPTFSHQWDEAISEYQAEQFRRAMSQLEKSA